MRARESAPVRFVRELGLPKAERRAARAERRAEEAMRRERDNTESNARRAAAIEAERRRHDGYKYRRPLEASARGRRRGERAQALARGLEQLLEAHRIGAVALVAQDARAAVDVVGAAEVQVEVQHLVGGQRPRAWRCTCRPRRG